MLFLYALVLTFHSKNIRT